MSALQHWSEALPKWAIPDEILQKAPESPWIHPVSKFTPDGNIHGETPSRLRALEALPHGGSVLDVGCGGGRAAFGLVPPARHVVGVDHQQGMLDVFAHEAFTREVTREVILGDWPDVADTTPVCDVVTCHHVFYNVANLAPFVHALSSHARHRVVVELPQHHPLSSLSPMWKKFWNLDRPISPTADDALAVVTSLGYNAHLEKFTQEIPLHDLTDEDVRFTRIRLCLTSDKDPEIRTYLEHNPLRQRENATLWWDV
jgi:SAM-dependent methyltransferase